MRDIIDEYMEEIKQASGVGCSTEGSKDAEALASETSTRHDNYDDFYKLTGSLDDSSELNRHLQHSDRKLLDSCGMESSYKQHSGDTHSYHDHPGSDRSIRRPHDEEDKSRYQDECRSGHNREDYRSSDRLGSRRSREDHPRSSDKKRSRWHRDDYFRIPNKRQSRQDRENYSGAPRERRSSHQTFSDEKDFRESSRELYSRSSGGNFTGSNKQHGHQSEDRHDSELNNKQRGKFHLNDRSASGFQDRYDSVSRDEFEDRYNPSESQGE